MADDANAAEHERRRNNRDAVIAYFKANPGCWINSSRLAEIGGSCAWRTRVSEARHYFRRAGGDILNRQWKIAIRDKEIIIPAVHAMSHEDHVPERRKPGKVLKIVVQSQYMYVVHKPIGPDAGEYRDRLLWPIR